MIMQNCMFYIILTTREEEKKFKSTKNCNSQNSAPHFWCHGSVLKRSLYMHIYRFHSDTHTAGSEEDNVGLDFL